MNGSIYIDRDQVRRWSAHKRLREEGAKDFLEQADVDDEEQKDERDVAKRQDIAGYAPQRVALKGKNQEIQRHHEAVRPLESPRIQREHHRVVLDAILGHA